MLSKNQETELSKFMSLVLRHKPREFGLKLDIEGFVPLYDLLNVIRQQKRFANINLEDIYQVVENCPKQRYSIDYLSIRANYGHSAQKIRYKEKIPPKTLYHGTNTRVVDLIFLTGIKPMNRKYVHMSESLEFATLAGQRRGELVILRIDTEKALKEGVKFYYAENEVWLADFIPQNSLSV